MLSECAARQLAREARKAPWEGRGVTGFIKHLVAGERIVSTRRAGLPEVPLPSKGPGEIPQNNIFCLCLTSTRTDKQNADKQARW